jgi:hypothetical protein
MRGKKSSGKIKISMSERVKAEEYFSSIFLSEKSLVKYESIKCFLSAMLLTQNGV